MNDTPDLARLMPKVVSRLSLGEPNAQLSRNGQLRFGAHGSLSIDLKKGIYFDHERKVGGGVLDLINNKIGGNRAEAIAWLKGEGLLEEQSPGSSKPSKVKPRITAVYDYIDEHGNTLFQVVRYEPKGFRQRCPDASAPSGYRWTTKGTPQVPYRLPELIKAVADRRTVLVCEGEKDCDNLRSLGFVATTNAGGAHKWRAELAPHFTGAYVVLLPHNDDAGRDHMHKVAASLKGVADCVRVLDVAKHWPACPSRGDISDWLSVAGNKEQLDNLIAGALVPAQPSAESARPPMSDADAQAEIERLAKLSPLAYARERKAATKRLKVTLSMLDRLVNQERSATASVVGQGRPIERIVHEPWGEAVDGSKLLTDIVAALERHLSMDVAATDAVALWIMARAALEAFQIFPRLLINSAAPDSGKSTLLQFIERLVETPVMVSSTTASSLFRMIEKQRENPPTFLLDEADATLRDNEELRALMNAGHSRSGTVMRNVLIRDDYEPRLFSAFAPTAIAGLGRQHPTIESRSIPIDMQPALPGTRIVPLREASEQLDELARKCVRWVQDHVHELARAKPNMPAALNNRVADNWGPLLSVSDVGGGEWSVRARAAATTLAKAAARDSAKGNGVLALIHIREVFQAINAPAIFSSELVIKLHAIEGAPWAEYGRTQRPISANSLARVLAPFKVRPSTIQIGQRNAKGYQRKWFDDAFKRHLPPAGESEPLNRQAPRAPRDSAEFEPSGNTLELTDGNPTGWASINETDGLTDENSALCEYEL